MDFRRSPVGIFLCQAPDQDANFLADSRSPATLSGPPPPIEAETGAMPADDGVGFSLMSASAKRDQSCCNKTRNNRSGALKRGRGRLRFSAPSCWRRASTSRAVSVRLRTNTRTTIRKARRNESSGSTVVTHRNAAEIHKALCAQAVEFGTGRLFATHDGLGRLK